MPPHLLIRVHTDLRSGFGRATRALVLAEHWRALGGICTLAISGDEPARKIAAGRHPFQDEALACRVVDLGEGPQAEVPEDLKRETTIALVDLGEISPELLQGLRPLKLAVMEDDGDAHEQADLLFQPFLDGISWPTTPVKTVQGRKLRPYETTHGQCRVLRGSAFAVVSPVATLRRPKREPLQPLAVHRILVSFGGTDGADLIHRAHGVLARLTAAGRWEGTCTLLAPGGFTAKPFQGCQVLERMPTLPRRLQEFDAVWCAGGATLVEALCLGIPVAVWAKNERQHMMVGDIALANGCYDLGIGPEADLAATEDALEHWLGPEGQETRQEQTRDGMLLVDGMGASRVVQELWALAGS